MAFQRADRAEPDNGRVRADQVDAPFVAVQTVQEQPAHLVGALLTAASGSASRASCRGRRGRARVSPSGWDELHGFFSTGGLYAQIAAPSGRRPSRCSRQYVVSRETACSPPAELDARCSPAQRRPPT
jgi:hypothetical protein